MYTVDHFVKAFRKECLVCANLYAKMPAGGLDYRPSAGQRSTLELLRYLGFGPYNGVRRIVAGDWSIGRPSNEVTRDWPPSDFPYKMAWQADEVERLVRSISEPALLTEEIKLPWGEVMKKGEALVAHPLKWLTAYRMQLFLYLKAAGNTSLGTADIWHVAG